MTAEIRTAVPPEVDPDDCATCGEAIPMYECPASQRPCGHHCNCSWIHDYCHWCCREFGEATDPRTGTEFPMESPVADLFFDAMNPLTANPQDRESREQVAAAARGFAEQALSPDPEEGR